MIISQKNECFNDFFIYFDENDQNQKKHFKRNERYLRVGQLVSRNGEEDLAGSDHDDLWHLPEDADLE